ncbi:unnamed protein product [Didymodactylos carnosus]|uniref:EGF-like domain-containing protein n=1 Tax=Didymodactylos carnosus TaxID=1234261 RepID=A0A813Q050_9BILA|nr:unnamed protein product [Didymodactylos carnosus]CAF0939989.1 unnamed protein product [Didymodactylos carnosus]CAF3537128.1 unnamed protein product [Didymodactylos carnosus]CAF3715282.1 unnamed protein product [Didymodactylos carnosus]
MLFSLGLFFLVTTYAAAFPLNDDFNPCKVSFSRTVFYYANPSDPQSYIQCDNNGNQFINYCAPNLIWDDPIKACNWPPTPLRTIPETTTTSTAPSLPIVSVCQPNPCYHGDCFYVVQSRTYACICEPNYIGKRCETNIDDLTTETGAIQNDILYDNDELKNPTLKAVSNEVIIANIIQRSQKSVINLFTKDELYHIIDRLLRTEPYEHWQDNFELILIEVSQKGSSSTQKKQFFTALFDSTKQYIVTDNVFYYNFDQYQKTNTQTKVDEMALINKLQGLTKTPARFQKVTLIHYNKGQTKFVSVIVDRETNIMYKESDEQESTAETLTEDRKGYSPFGKVSRQRRQFDKFADRDDSENGIVFDAAVVYRNDVKEIRIDFENQQIFVVYKDPNVENNDDATEDITTIHYESQSNTLVKNQNSEKNGEELFHTNENKNNLLFTTSLPMKNIKSEEIISSTTETISKAVGITKPSDMTAPTTTLGNLLSTSLEITTTKQTTPHPSETTPSSSTTTIRQDNVDISTSRPSETASSDSPTTIRQDNQITGSADISTSRPSETASSDSPITIRQDNQITGSVDISTSRPSETASSDSPITIRQDNQITDSVDISTSRPSETASSDSPTTIRQDNQITDSVDISTTTVIAEDSSIKSN